MDKVHPPKNRYKDRYFFFSRMFFFKKMVKSRYFLT